MANNNTDNNPFAYPQRYFLVSEACRHFGLKLRTFKAWREAGIEIPGLIKVKGSNYYIIDPIPFHTWLIETRLEPATQKNKIHNRKPKKNSSNVISTKMDAYVVNQSTGGVFSNISSPVETSSEQKQ